MQTRTRSWILALLLANVLACGDDDPSPVTPDSGVIHPDGMIKTDSSVPQARDAGATLDGSARDAAVADSAVSVDSGRAAPVDSGAASGSDAGMSTLSAECSSCEKSACGAIEYQFDGIGTDLTTLCTKVDGSASDGPKKGTARSQLCSDLVACARRTDCAKDGYLGCLCGDMKFAECYDYASSHGGAIMLPGVCRAEFLAASETTSWSRIAELNGLLGSTLEGQPGDAFKGYAALFDCSRQYCFDDCYQHVCPSAANQTKCGPEASDSCMSGKCVAGIPPTKFCAESQYGATCGTSVPGMRACQNRVCVELASSCATQTDGAVCSLAEGTGVCANKTCTPLLEACFEGDNGKACKPIVAGTSRPGVCVSTTVTGDLGPTTSYECALPSCSPSDLTSHCSP